ncbi:CGI-07 protein [Salpingoeca rosetta]|uniref:60S ribosomal export protein NMD3 n=1 Tax=Salpingoeca rosetta (strain ATCC 50818 / BSB-021) TaxID=946362 RepID=F2U4G7_SALR5|nr:CGI-07 protein [Salpingoeca rosetta]EGD82533.1 CGI-07 protein [Salpingoeca rosetta]|eukprot:XP_004995769.1 CGI-07 protein [Salpingoeca rosetta]
MDPSMQGVFQMTEDMASQQAQAMEAAQQYILCCECGMQITPNPARMCVSCIRSRVDITDGIPKSVALFHCKGCGRYSNPPKGWLVAQLESRELLSLCLRKLTGLSKVRLVDAGFIWTEPHSKRVKVRLVIQKEVLSDVILQQEFIVEFVVRNEFCSDCHRIEAKDTWNAVVQVRQKVPHKKTFYHLEQIIIKHKAHAKTTRISSVSDGVDFFFGSSHDARRFVNFLESVVPIRTKTSQRLISQDFNSNTYNFKYTYSVEIIPVCKNDIVCMSPQVSHREGHISPVCLCTQVGTVLHFIDPFTLQIAHVRNALFWQHPFNAIASHGSLIEFIVMDVEPVYDEHHNEVTNGKFLLVNVVVVRANELETGGQEFQTRSHLGHILRYGDTVLGFDFTTANVNDEYFNRLDTSNFPDVILVRKSHAERRKRRRGRNFKLKYLAKEEDGAGDGWNGHWERRRRRRRRCC